MKSLLMDILQRLVRILAVHTTFVVLATAFLMTVSVFAERPNIGALNLTLVSIFVLIPWLMLVVVPCTIPSLICSLLIYLIGGFFREPIAMTIAALGGAVVMYLSLSGSYPSDMKFPLSTTSKVALTTLYVFCWIAVRKFMPKLVGDQAS